MRPANDEDETTGEKGAKARSPVMGATVSHKAVMSLSWNQVHRQVIAVDQRIIQ
jgi:hypothetical protein